MKLPRTFRMACSVALLPSLAWAHDAVGHVSPDELWSAWSFEPWVIAGVLLATGLYLNGLRRLRQPPGQIAAFMGGMIALALTLLSPIHRLGSELFSAHMTQHELLMLIAAPLLVLGKPGAAMVWGLPSGLRRPAARTFKAS